MRSWIKVLLAISLMFGWLLSVGYSQEDMLAIDTSFFEEPRRPPSVFEHDAHNENAGLEECSECHHLYEDGQLLEGESSEDQRCADCHGIEPEGSQPGLMKAFHMNCKGCHQKEMAGPIMCGECHKKSG
jgi:hypothetical protein